MNLCNNILDLGEFSVCDIVETGYTAQKAGLHTVYFDYIGETIEYSVTLSIGEKLIIPLSGLSEYHTFLLFGLDPDQNKIILENDSVNYDTFRLTTKGIKSISGSTTTPTPIYNGAVIMFEQILNCLNTTTDGSLASNQAVAATPIQSTEIEVLYNGREMNVGIGTKAGVDCFFSADGGLTAKSEVSIGDKLYWNGSVAEFQLDTQDTVEISFLTPKNV